MSRITRSFQLRLNGSTRCPKQLARIRVPVAIMHSEHADYFARSIPGAEFVLLQGLSHFAPLQRPEQFNNAMLGFLGQLS